MKSLLLGLCCAATLFAAAAEVENKAPAKRGGDESAQRAVKPAARRARGVAHDQAARRAQMEQRMSQFREMRKAQNAKAMKFLEALDKSKLSAEEQKDVARYIELRKARDAQHAAQKPGERPNMAQQREFSTLSHKVRPILTKCVLLNSGLSAEQATAASAQLKELDGVFSFQMPGRSPMGFGQRGPNGGNRMGPPHDGQKGDGNPPPPPPEDDKADK